MYKWKMGHKTFRLRYFKYHHETGLKPVLQMNQGKKKNSRLNDVNGVQNEDVITSPTIFHFFAKNEFLI
jgi:hypothetical protein